MSWFCIKSNTQKLFGSIEHKLKDGTDILIVGSCAYYKDDFKPLENNSYRTRSGIGFGVMGGTVWMVMERI